MARPRLYDHEVVLNRWRDGAKLPELAAWAKVSRDSIMDVIVNARKRGDPRAVRRYHVEYWRERERAGAEQ